MGGMKRLAEDLKSYGGLVTEKACVRKKYKTEQSAINSSFAIDRQTGRLTTTPEFCQKCGAWHTRYKQ